MSSHARPDEPLLDLPADDGATGENLNHQVQRTEEQILLLRRQQEALEQEKRELEELGRRQEQFQTGRTDLVEKLARSRAVLDREISDAQKRCALLQDIRESFAQHLDILDAINAKNWNPAELHRELTKGLGAVDDARTDYVRSFPKISPDRAGDLADAADGARGEADSAFGKDFIYWLRSGFAFTLPLLAPGVILIVVLVAVFNRQPPPAP